jgi:hypothetical protein
MMRPMVLTNDKGEGIFGAELMAKFLSRIPNPKLEKPFKVDELPRAVSHRAAVPEISAA